MTTGWQLRGWWRRGSAAFGVWLMLAGAASASTLEVSVRHAFDGEPLRFDSLRYSQPTGETLSVTRLSYLLSGFALRRAGSAEWTECPGQVEWIEAAAGRPDFQIAAVPVGRYSAVRFSVGLDAATNASDPAQYPADHPLNANRNGLHWGWQGGYIFLALEGNFRRGTDMVRGYSYHLARAPRRTEVTLPVEIDLRTDAALALEFDAAKVWNGPKRLEFQQGVATHSRDGDPVAAALRANLSHAFRVQPGAPMPPISPAVVPKPISLPATFTPYRFAIPRGFPLPNLPADNPLIEERVALGERLFRETALSRDGSLSCASCHQAGAAFAENRRTSTGVDGAAGTRNAMPLFNLAWKNTFFWDGRAPSLREQVLLPIQEHREMDETLPQVVHKLACHGEYTPLFRAAFSSPEVTAEKIALALEQYLLTLTSGTAKLDRAMRGEATLSSDEQRGFELFMTEYEPRTGQYGADCFHCHGGALFTDHQFHQNGLPLAEADLGRYRVTGQDGDRGKFSTPSLRNLTHTAPYMHDGRFATLEEVVQHYVSPMARTATLDPNLAKHPAGGLPLTPADQRALVAFLRALSD